MKVQIGYYDEQGIYIEELVDVIERTSQELIQEKKHSFWLCMLS